MKKLLSFFAFIILLTCSKDDSNSDQQANNTFEGGTIYTSQIVEIEIDNATQETYTGFLGEQEIELRRTTENALVFFVEPSSLLGENVLTVQGLNNLKVNYIIESTVLDQSVEETITPYFDLLEQEKLLLTPQDNGDKAIALIDGFNNMYATLSDTQKQDISIFYKANKGLIDATITGDFNKFNSTVVTQFTRCKSSIYLTGILGVFTTISTSLPLTQIVTPLLAVSTGVLLAKTYENCSSLANETIKNVFVKAENQLFNSKTNATAISFNTEVSRVVPIELQNRTMLPEDSTLENSIISTYFSSTGDFNELVIQKMNTAINYLNTEWSLFFDITPYEEITANDTATSVTNALTQEVFENFTFSISGNNIELQNLTFSNGGIDTQIDIIDQSATIDGVETGTLNFTYEDDFNSFSGSFDIEVYTDSIAGVWLLNFPNCIPVGDCGVDNPITLNPNGTVTFPSLNLPSITIVNSNYTYTNNILTIDLDFFDDNTLECDGEIYDYTINYASNFSLTQTNTNEFNGVINESSSGFSAPSGNCVVEASSGSESITLSRQ